MNTTLSDFFQQLTKCHSLDVLTNEILSLYFISNDMEIDKKLISVLTSNPISMKIFKKINELLGGYNHHLNPDMLTLCNVKQHNDNAVHFIFNNYIPNEHYLWGLQFAIRHKISLCEAMTYLYLKDLNQELADKFYQLKNPIKYEYFNTPTVYTLINLLSKFLQSNDADKLSQKYWNEMFDYKNLSQKTGYMYVLQGILNSDVHVTNMPEMRMRFLSNIYGKVIQVMPYAQDNHYSEVGWKNVWNRLAQIANTPFGDKFIKNQFHDESETFFKMLVFFYYAGDKEFEKFLHFFNTLNGLNISLISAYQILTDCFALPSLAVKLRPLGRGYKAMTVKKYILNSIAFS